MSSASPTRRRNRSGSRSPEKRQRSSSPAKKATASASAAETKPKMNPDFKENTFLVNLGDKLQESKYNTPPNIKTVSFRVALNFSKASILPWMLGLMCYFDNWSIGAWIYTVIHASYGIIWCIKDLTFPDASFDGVLSLGSLISLYGWVLCPYYAIGYLVVSGGDAQRNPSNERIFCALMLYIHGLVFMVLTDAQKYLVLRERKGLIIHGMMGWSRNMNYFGEIMIYASFGIMCQRTEIWCFLLFVWTMLFGSAMMVKDYSLSKKVEWPGYE